MLPRRKKKDFRVGVIVTEREDQKHYFRKNSTVMTTTMTCTIIFIVDEIVINLRSFAIVSNI